jgi:hypothetical protein
MTTYGIMLQVTKTPGITVADFRADMAEKWQRMTAKKGGTLFGKTFIPFGKEADIRDVVMTNIFQQKNNFLRSTKQRIVQNINNMQCPFDIVTGSAEDMDAETVTIRDIFINIKITREVNCSTQLRKLTKAGHIDSSFTRARYILLTTCSTIWTQH